MKVVKEISQKIQIDKGSRSPNPFRNFTSRFTIHYAPEIFKMWRYGISKSYWHSNFTLGVESNWNSFEICLIWFQNLRFHWFERAKNILKIQRKLIWFVQFNSNYRMESIFQKLNSFKIDLNSEKIFEKFYRNQFQICSIRLNSTSILLEITFCWIENVIVGNLRGS